MGVVPSECLCPSGTSSLGVCLNEASRDTLEGKVTRLLGRGNVECIGLLRVKDSVLSRKPGQGRFSESAEFYLHNNLVS